MTTFAVIISYIAITIITGILGFRYYYMNEDESFEWALCCSIIGALIITEFIYYVIVTILQ